MKNAQSASYWSSMAMELIAATAISSILVMVPGIRAAVGFEIEFQKLSVEQIEEQYDVPDLDGNGIGDFFEMFEDQHGVRRSMLFTGINVAGKTLSPWCIRNPEHCTGVFVSPKIQEQMSALMPISTEDCDDNVDNDVDGLIDNEDAQCVLVAEESEEEEVHGAPSAVLVESGAACLNGEDDDGNGAADCIADPNCDLDPVCNSYWQEVKEGSYVPPSYHFQQIQSKENNAVKPYSDGSTTMPSLQLQPYQYGEPSIFPSVTGPKPPVVNPMGNSEYVTPDGTYSDSNGQGSSITNVPTIQQYFQGYDSASTSQMQMGMDDDEDNENDDNDGNDEDETVCYGAFGDQDQDGVFNAWDQDCMSGGSSSITTDPMHGSADEESMVAGNCNDNDDNNDNGSCDSEESECRTSIDNRVEICGDGEDNDGDTRVDYGDCECQS